MFISFIIIDKRSYKEKNEYEKGFFLLHMDFKDERNNKGEIYVVCFIRESILNKLSCQ